MKRFVSTAAATIAVLAFALTLPAVAQAWYVDISITGAGRVYETTDADEIDEHCPDAIEGFASSSTTPTGSLGATCRAGDATGDYGHGWVVRYVAEPAAGYRFAGWQSDGRTNPAPVLCDGSGGSSTYSGAACQFATFQNLQTRARFVDDTDPAMSSLIGPNQVVNGPATFTFSAASDPTFRFFECQVAGVHAWQTCSSGRTEDPPVSGTYTFEVRAVDWSGNRSTISSWGWTVDKVPPETNLLTGPAGAVSSKDATFTFSSNESGTFVCTLDGTSVGCGSPKSYSNLLDGPHTFGVAARDVAGNVDPTPAERTWTVDTTAPPPPVLTGPEGGHASKTATFTWAAVAGASGYLCSLDGAAFQSCTSGIQYTNLSEGPHYADFKSVDAAANESIPVHRAWVVDTVAPAAPTIVDGPSGLVRSTAGSFTFTGDADTQSFWCKLDGGAFTACASGVAYPDLAQGSHTAQFRARDAVGNESAVVSRTWIVDTIAPAAPVLAPASADQTSVSVTWPAATDSNGPVSYDLFLDGSKVATTTGTAHVFAGLACGQTRTAGIEAFDAAGNRSSRSTRDVSTSACAAPPPPPTGPAPRCAVPALKGKTLAQARTALKRNRCTLGKVTRVFHATIRKGRIVKQSPAAKRTLKAGAKVNVVVSRGKRR